MRIEVLWIEFIDFKSGDEQYIVLDETHVSETVGTGPESQGNDLPCRHGTVVEGPGIPGGAK